MSRQIGMDCIQCKPIPRPGHVAHSMEYYGALISKITSVDPGQGGISKNAAEYDLLSPDVMRRFCDAWDYDFLWGTNDGYIDWAKAGRCTNMGHAVYATDGSDQTAAAVSPFTKPEEVWAFDPVAEYSLIPFAAWAQTSIDVYIQHDDIVWTAGPFIHPDFYRSVIFPIYRELWKPLKAAGK